MMLACGFVCGFGIVLMSASSAYTEDIAVRAFNGGSSIIALTLVAAVPVVVAVSKLLADEKLGSYALWILAGSYPAKVCLVVLVQAFFVSLIGAALGMCLSFIAGQFSAVSVLFRYVGISDAVVSPNSVYAVEFLIGSSLLVVAASFFELKSILHISPLEALFLGSDYSASSHRGVFFKCAMGFALLAVTCAVSFGASGGDVSSVVSIGVIIPLFTTLSFALLAPVFLPLLLRVWAAAMPWRRNPIWRIAWRGVAYEKENLASIEVPLLVAFSLVSGALSSVEMLLVFLEGQGSAPAVGLSAYQAMLFFGGPMVVCGVGAVASVLVRFASSRKRASTLFSCGLDGAGLAKELLAEALIHAVNAGLLGVIAVGVSCGFVSIACGASVWGNLKLLEGAWVLLFGLLLLLLASIPAFASSFRGGCLDGLSE